MTTYINGRFLTQPLSGVQRYAREITRALDAELARSQRPQHQLGPIEVLLPHAAPMPDWQVLRPA